MNFLNSHARTIERITFLCAGAFLGVGGYLFYDTYGGSQRATMHQIREDITNYRLIDPLLACDSGVGGQGERYKELEDVLNDVVGEAKKDGGATDVSIYFRELPGGRWVGIDENHSYDPASLLKIVLMITYFKESIAHPNLFNEKYTYTQALSEINTTIPFVATTSLTVGTSYSVKELIATMISESDNGATFTLLQNVDHAYLEQVYKDLGLPSPENVKGTYTITPKQYSLFFRILFNATYLDRKASEDAMALLSHATYRDGIVSGVPSGTIVAHKFGEHVTGSSDGKMSSVELHDCGIVYGPNLPYFLCVMTSGKDLNALARVIGHVSKTVYDSVDVLSER